MEEKKLSHLDGRGQPAMVDVSGKAVTTRLAKAACEVFLGRELMGMLENGDIKAKKGPVFQTAIIAGTMAAKNTSQLIPFCHPLSLEGITFEILPKDSESISITCQVKCSGKTGVEMEALTGVSAAALTVYDMCKAVSHAIVIRETRLVKKTGGKSGDVFL